MTEPIPEPPAGSKVSRSDWAKILGIIALFLLVLIVLLLLGSDDHVPDRTLPHT